MTNIVGTSRVVSGSKPRKFVTKTILTNPSLYSLSMTSLLDPENQALPKIYKALEKKQEHIAMKDSQLYKLITEKSSKSEVKDSLLSRQLSHQTNASRKSKQKDSLQMAEREFEQRKSQAAEQRKPMLARQPSNNSQLSRGSSMPALLGLHYRTSKEIMQKQASQYNIISNF